MQRSALPSRDFDGSFTTHYDVANKLSDVGDGHARRGHQIGAAGRPGRAGLTPCTYIHVHCQTFINLIHSKIDNGFLACGLTRIPSVSARAVRCPSVCCLAAVAAVRGSYCCLPARHSEPEYQHRRSRSRPAYLAMMYLFVCRRRSLPSTSRFLCVLFCDAAQQACATSMRFER